jgi:hypothetical protein
MVFRGDVDSLKTLSSKMKTPIGLDRHVEDDVFLILFLRLFDDRS